MKLRRADGLLIGVLLLLSAGLWMWNARSGGGGWAVVTVDGAEAGRYRLQEDQEISIQTERGYNLLVIREGTASIAEADCGDHTCVRRGMVSRTGETIVCLPHRLVVEIVGGEHGGPDAVAGG